MRARVPVRIGNGAFDQRQNDVFGAVLDSILLHTRHSERLPRRLWPIVQSQAECATGVWREPDQGIWEARGKPQHYVFVQAHVLGGARPRRQARRVARRSGPAGNLDRHRGGDPLRHPRARRPRRSPSPALRHRRPRRIDPPGSRSSASCPATTRCCATSVDAIANDLTEDGFVLRYRTEETDDGLSGKEGTFLICSFWLVSALAIVGEAQRARDLMERLLRIASPLGLYAEEFDAATGRHLGNFPQAFSHLALIEAAARIIVPEMLAEYCVELRRRHHRLRRGRRHARAPPRALRQARPPARAGRLAAARAAELALAGRLRRQPLHLAGHVGRRRRQAVPAAGALLRRRRDQALRRRALPSAQGGLRRAPSPRRDLARLAGLVRRLRAVLLAGRAAVRGPRRARGGSDRASVQRAVSVPACVARAAHPAARRRLRGRRPPPVSRAVRGASPRALGQEILLLERGDWLPREPQNWLSQDVFVDNRYISPDTWVDGEGKAFQPQVHYFVGGRDEALRRGALPAARGGLRRAPAPRRDLARLAGLLRRLRAVLHPGRAALRGARRARGGSDRAACERAVSVPARSRTSRGSSSSPTTSRPPATTRFTLRAGSGSWSRTCPTAPASAA